MPPQCNWVSSLPCTVYHLCPLYTGLLQRTVVRVTHVHSSLAPTGSQDGASRAGISLGPCLPHSLAPRPLQPSCPPAPPQRPSHRSRCPHYVSAPPSLTAREGKPTVSACSAPGLTVGPWEWDDLHMSHHISLQCQLWDT